MIAEFRLEMHTAAARRIGRRRTARRVLAIEAAMAVAVAVAGISLATTGALFHATPAPPEVVEDFGTYTPQLGFNPAPGRARLVAQDGEYLLYATSNKQGGYCVIDSTPAKRPGKMNDGGHCEGRRFAQEPIVAGVPSISGAKKMGDVATALVIGKVRDPAARTIRFKDGEGEQIERPIGADGFFIATAKVRMCPKRDWVSLITALDAGDRIVASGMFTLVYLPGVPGVCGSAYLMRPGVRP